MPAAAVAGSLFVRLARTGFALAADTVAAARSDHPGFDKASRVVGAALQVVHPRSPYAPAVFGAVVAVVLALLWSDVARRDATSASGVFRLPGAVGTPVPTVDPPAYAPPR